MAQEVDDVAVFVICGNEVSEGGEAVCGDEGIYMMVDGCVVRLVIWRACYLVEGVMCAGCGVCVVRGGYPLIEVIQGAKVFPDVFNCSFEEDVGVCSGCGV